ncbi:hypothetical protein GGC64_002121 [Mycobacterium sp. OAS707]|uniref:hypothetical protein n=1 Tax=Mycobacterium sp. OAS707 TaxID=2663822 RepID=UPI00178B9B80|nr:hypothetical protein [Mycobacterium sp. OAS707]MBE1548113.1 hypothetical protein [Mycobacterium sp. OAS707]
MVYNDTFFSREDRYSIGIEEDSAQPYVSIPVSNGMFDYEEYYKITSDQYQAFLNDRDAAIEFVESCRRHERDALLIEKPGSNRGTPV